MIDSSRFSESQLSLHLSLPRWATAELNALPTHLPAVDERMAAVIRFARLNVEHDTGGPFAAGVFEQYTGRLVVIGVNRVVPSNCSSAHAEVMALSLAQKILGSFDLGGHGLPAHELVVNWRPCAMCFGAVLWSGVRSLVIAGDGPELETITGFDEGPVPEAWRAELGARGVALREDILRGDAIAAFKAYAAGQPFVYNARQGPAE